MKSSDRAPLRLGVHTSIAGGLHRALLRGEELGCQVVQFFTQPPGQWKGRPLSRQEVSLFQETARLCSVEPTMTHTAYLINLASPCSNLARKSVVALHREMKRAESLGVPFTVVHPGAHMGRGEQKGLDRVVRRLDQLHERTAGFRTRVLLETTAGQGSTLGSRLEQFRYILEGVKNPEGLGICLDTCHMFAAGYDLRTPAGYRETMERLDSIIGLAHVEAIHMNDTRTPLGSRVDRHEHIGKGRIGRPGFRNLLRDSRLRGIPMVLETPKGSGNGVAEDRRNLRELQRIAGEGNEQ